jgi:gliding motility-associated-like protein
MKNLFLLITALLAVLSTRSQEHYCGTHFTQEDMHHLKTVIRKIAKPIQKNGDLDCVPIRYHIVRSDDGASLATQEAVVYSLTMLNKQFFDANLSFYLVEPPVFVDDSDYLALGNGVTEADIRGLFDTPQNAVQIYVMDDLNGPGGYAYYPSPTVVSNAIFLLSNAVQGSLGGTIPHEMGHYFSLPHTFEGTENGNTDANAENVDRTGPNANCETTGDLFCDTNADPGNNGFVDNCVYIGTEVDVTGTVYDPPLDNPMSYHPPQCKSYMTPEQYASMEQGYAFRQSQTAYNLNGPGLDVEAPTNLNYEVDTNGDLIFTFQDNADNEYGYFLEMSTEGADMLVAIPGASVIEDQTTFTFSDYDPDLSYWFRVKPATGSCSSTSNTVFIPGGISLDVDGSSGAAPSNYIGESLCGGGVAHATDNDVQLLGSANGVEITVQLTNALDGSEEWLEADDLSTLNVAGIGTHLMTAVNSDNLPAAALVNWLESVTYHHNGEAPSQGTRSVRFTIASAESDGVSAKADIFVDKLYSAGSGGVLTACPLGSPSWTNLLPENADPGVWTNSEGEQLSGAFTFESLDGSYTFVTGSPQCEVESTYSVVETEAPEWDLTLQNPECETKCTGSVEAAYTEGFQVSLDGIPFEDTMDDLCAAEYLFQITNGTGCGREQTITLRNAVVPIVNFPSELCTGDVIILSDYVSLPFGTVASLNGAPISIRRPELISPSDTNQISFYNYEGCIDREFEFASSNCPTPNNTHFFIPNAFTPDGDGLNDLFKPICAYDLEFYELFIFDRMGSVIFETDEINQGWNGSGSSDTDYFSPTTQVNYRIKYKLPNEQEFREIQGSTIVLR